MLQLQTACRVRTEPLITVHHQIAISKYRNIIIASQSPSIRSVGLQWLIISTHLLLRRLSLPRSNKRNLIEEQKKFARRTLE
jgi:hypothetical protein